MKWYHFPGSVSTPLSTLRTLGAGIAQTKPIITCTPSRSGFDPWRRIASGRKKLDNEIISPEKRDLEIMHGTIEQNLQH